MNRAIDKLKTQSVFNRADVELLRRETGIAEPIPNASTGSGENERWTREAITRWAKRSPRGRPLTGLVTR